MDITIDYVGTIEDNAAAAILEAGGTVTRMAAPCASYESVTFPSVYDTSIHCTETSDEAYALYLLTSGMIIVVHDTLVLTMLELATGEMIEAATDDQS